MPSLFCFVGLIFCRPCPQSAPSRPGLRDSLCGRLEAFCTGFGRMKTALRRIVIAEVLQHIVDGIFKARAGSVRGSYAF